MQAIRTKNIAFIEVPVGLINQGRYNSLGKTQFIVLKNDRFVGISGFYPEVPDEAPELFRLWLRKDVHRDFNSFGEMECYVDEYA